MTLRPALAVLLALSGISAGAKAADLHPPAVPAPVDPATTGYIVTLGGTVQLEPSFPGSDRYRVFGYPSIDVRRVGEPERFKAPDDGFDFALFESRWVRFGPVARFRSGRDRDDDRELRGLRDIDWSIEAGAFLDVWPTEFLRARAELRYGFLGHEGVVGNLGLDFVQRWDALTASIGPRVAFGDDRFTREYFGVTPLEAARNGRVTPFNPEGGVTSVGVLGSLSYKWSEQWSTTAFAGYDRLVGDAGKSPIPRKLGSRDQYVVGTSVAYSFYFPGF